MRILKSPVFLFCCLLFIGHQLLQKVWEIKLPVIDAYLDSFLLMPLLLTLLVVERRWLFRRGSGYCLKVLDIVMATLFIAVVAELVFPALSDRFTADWWDVLAYTLGSGLFYFTINGYPKTRHKPL